MPLECSKEEHTWMEAGDEERGEACLIDSHTRPTIKKSLYNQSRKVEKAYNSQ